MALKENLVKLMKDKHLTIQELSMLTNISVPTLKRLRTSENSNPTLDILIKISNALKIPINFLVQDSKQLFLLGDKIILNSDEEEFVVIITEDYLSFKNGTKAIFRRYEPNATLTKYIILKNGNIMETIDSDKFLFKDSKQSIFSVEEEHISGYIIKEIYEINY